jgi:hypothetical protein
MISAMPHFCKGSQAFSEPPSFPLILAGMALKMTVADALKCPLSPPLQG